jgi:hypothetical protein
MPPKKLNRSDYLKKSAGRFGSTGYITFIPDEGNGNGNRSGNGNATGKSKKAQS